MRRTLSAWPSPARWFFAEAVGVLLRRGAFWTMLSARPKPDLRPTADRRTRRPGEDAACSLAQALADFAQDLSGAEGLGAIGLSLKRAMALCLPGAGIAILLARRGSTRLAPCPQAGPEGGSLASPPPSGGLAQRCAELRREVVEPAGDGAIAAAWPLIAAGSLVGVATAVVPRAPSEGERSALPAFCAIAALALSRHEELHTGRLLRQTVEHSGEAVTLYDAAGTILFSNPAYHRIFDHYPPPAELRGMTHGDLYRWDLERGIIDDPLALADPALYLAERLRIFAALRGEVRETQKIRDCTYLYTRVRLDSGETLSRRTDITEIKAAERQLRATQQRLEALAYVDAITGLPNRVAFREAVERALEALRAAPGGRLSIVFLNLDRFKGMNDALGDLAGDALLGAVARRLRASLPAGDQVARLGGDEFALLRQHGAGAAGGPDGLARDAQKVFAEAFTVDGRRLAVGASLGGVAAPDDGTTVDGLLQNASLAIRRAKAAGGAAYRGFEPAMEAALIDRQRLGLDLREAMALDQLDLHYQPIVDLATGRVSAAEALLRWQHPTRGAISPQTFIPLAEELGLIVAIGDWVLRRACRDAAAWPPSTRIAINLSPRQFAGTDLADAILAAAAAHGFDLRRLELEITESVLLQDDPSTLALLRRLRGLGVRIALDDFGTGFASLGYLLSFPFTKIKIDRSFVAGIVDRAESLAIVTSVADLARRLGMTTTAEGVETTAQLARLRAIGCTEAQGFLIARPRPLPEALAWLAAGPDAGLQGFGLYDI